MDKTSRLRRIVKFYTSYQHQTMESVLHELTDQQINSQILTRPTEVILTKKFREIWYVFRKHWDDGNPSLSLMRSRVAGESIKENTFYTCSRCGSTLPFTSYSDGKTNYCSFCHIIGLRLESSDHNRPYINQQEYNTYISSATDKDFSDEALEIPPPSSANTPRVILPTLSAVVTFDDAANQLISVTSNITRLKTPQEKDKNKRLATTYSKLAGRLLEAEFKRNPADHPLWVKNPRLLDFHLQAIRTMFSSYRSSETNVPRMLDYDLIKNPIKLVKIVANFLKDTGVSQIRSFTYSDSSRVPRPKDTIVILTESNLHVYTGIERPKLQAAAKKIKSKKDQPQSEPSETNFDHLEKALWEVDRVEDKPKSVDFYSLSPEERVEHMRNYQNWHKERLREEAMDAAKASLGTMDDDQLLEFIKRAKTTPTCNVTF